MTLLKAPIISGRDLIFKDVKIIGLDHPFGHVLGRGGFHIRPEQGRYGICPYSLDQTMIKAKLFKEQCLKAEGLMLCL